MTRDIGRTFLQETTYEHMRKSDQDLGLPQPPLELPYDPRCPSIPLPGPESLQMPDSGLRTVVENRRSLRAYAHQPLNLDELSWLLWCTQGVQKTISRPATLRPVPSAGARHAFETYLLLNQVAGVPRGLYRFIASEHKLIEIDRQPDISARIVAALYNQEMAGESAATFIWVAVIYRMCWRYGERGYRYILLDAGHVCQNLYLAAEAIGCGACAIGAFYDDQLNAALGLDGKEQYAIYGASVGKKK